VFQWARQAAQLKKQQIMLVNIILMKRWAAAVDQAAAMAAVQDQDQDQFQVQAIHIQVQAAIHIQDLDQAVIQDQDQAVTADIQEEVDMAIQEAVVMAADIDKHHMVGDHDVDSSVVNGGGSTTTDGWDTIHTRGHGEASTQEWADTASISQLTSFF